MSDQKMKFDEHYERLLTKKLIRQNLQEKKEVAAYQRWLWLKTWGSLIQALCFSISWAIIIGFLLVPQLIGSQRPNWQWAMALFGFVIAFLRYTKK